MATKTYKRKIDKLQNVKEKIPSYGTSTENDFLTSIEFHPTNYLKQILTISEPYLKEVFMSNELEKFIQRIRYIDKLKDVDEIIKEFSKQYITFIKEKHQRSYLHSDKNLNEFIHNSGKNIRIIWGEAYRTLKALDNESIHLMVTSPPYYNAREYSTWANLNEYLRDMQHIISEAYRVLDNHRVFIFNVGDIFDNDNLKTKSVWGSRRLPLGAYFIKIFEEVGFTFVDDFIWDKGEVQSERHKNGTTPFPFYQYPMNCYEHILVFHKHRIDKTRYPCPLCGCLKVNSNTQSEIGIQSWECKNEKCFVRSKSNRGKRFSLKSLFTQAGQNENNLISIDLIKKWRRDICRFNPVIKINSKGENILGHTAPFPEDIPEMAVNFFSYPNEIVLDPFAGSFTTAIVAKRLGRIGVGIELNKQMFRKSIIKNIDKKLGFESDFLEYNY